MRGKPFFDAYKGLSRRNIPAYAGKTASTSEDSTLLTEHPRVCGENGCFTTTGDEQHGTSPRMRGKRVEFDLDHLTRRNIPAYAGKTPVKVAAACLQAEHPRVCGENRALYDPKAVARRNIPAYAGKTL